MCGPCVHTSAPGDRGARFEENYWHGHREFLLWFVCKVPTAFLTIKIATVPFVYVTLRAAFVLH